MPRNASSRRSGFHRSSTVVVAPIVCSRLSGGGATMPAVLREGGGSGGAVPAELFDAGGSTGIAGALLGIAGEDAEVVGVRGGGICAAVSVFSLPRLTSVSSP